MSDTVLYCANHPSVETTLRCNRCEKPICSKCAVQTPVGYRCRECVRGQQAVFETAKTRDYPVAAVVAAIGTAIGAAVLGVLGFWGFLVAPIVGGGLAEGIRWAVGRRRSRYLPRWAAIGAALGMIPTLVGPVITLLAIGGALDAASLGAILLGAAFPLIYGALIISTLYYRLGGIRL
ncbi:MAG TPA: hypothetical protein VFI11_03205 [Anaerolineales bacterium]|nr:hypothetical protein [Anaerolineales bacterium]